MKDLVSLLEYLNQEIIVPFVDRVAFKVDILERQLPPFKMSVITEDNVEVELVSTVFFRVLDAAKSVYRI